jgi:hypothetical protein
MSDITPKTPRTRESYEPPQLRIISLVAEEVLAVGCKLGSGPGPFGANCLAVPCVVNRGS